MAIVALNYMYVYSRVMSLSFGTHSNGAAIFFLCLPTYGVLSYSVSRADCECIILYSLYAMYISFHTFRTIPSTIVLHDNDFGVSTHVLLQKHKVPVQRAHVSFNARIDARLHSYAFNSQLLSTGNYTPNVL
jgi:hypothetical protein